MNVTKIQTKYIKLYEIKKFLSEDECKNIINLVENEQVYKQIDEQGKLTTYLYSKYYNEFYKELNKKIHNVLEIPLEYGEVIQVQYYRKMNSIDYHFDFFNPLLDFEKKQLDKSGQRTWTFLIYLNNVEKGGETHFSEENLFVKPEIGKAILWKNLENGQPNYYTKHSGMPIIEGEKYIITKWFREKPINY